MVILLVIPKVRETYLFDHEVKRKMDYLKRKNAQKIDVSLLTVVDLKKVEREIYKHSQLESFPTEYRHLTNNQEVKKTSPLL